MKETEYIGLTIEEAQKLAGEQGTETRVVREDGKNYMVTMDFHPDRLNFGVDKGIITEVTTG